MKQLLILALVACLTACASSSSVQQDGAAGEARLGIDQLGRTPLPVGTKIKGADSVIFGVGDNWTGRAVLVLPDDVSTNYNFFAEQFPRQGWTLVTAMRGKRSLLVFTRADRTTTIEMDEANLLSSVTAYMTMSPTSSNSSGVGASTGANNASTSTPRR